jgi:hypothetical protein
MRSIEGEQVLTPLASEGTVTHNHFYCNRYYSYFIYFRDFLVGWD